MVHALNTMSQNNSHRSPTSRFKKQDGVGDKEMIFDMPSCGGCSTCELACSFHHRGEFVPTVSSLRILAKQDAPGFLVLLVDESDGQSIACDGCEDLDVPLCMEYCKESDDLGEILKDFEENRK